MYFANTEEKVLTSNYVTMSNESICSDPEVQVGKGETVEENRMIYGLQEQPPWSMTIFLSIQVRKIEY